MEVMMNDMTPPPLHIPSHQILLQEASEDDHENKAPKKRAETWVQDEIRALIAFRRELDPLFNTSKSNKHLWEQISFKMRERGYDRSATMCTDKWRNLLKEYRKSKPSDRAGSVKHSCFKDLEELLQQRPKASTYKLQGGSDAYIQYSPKGSRGSTGNIVRRLDSDGQISLALPSNAAVVENGLSTWSWREAMTNGSDRLYGGKVIFVKLGELVKRIGVDGTAEAIKDAIKSSFGLRSERAFWLEDEEGIVRCLDRDMPAGAYTLHLDEGVTIKICFQDKENEHLLEPAEEKTFYSEAGFNEFLRRRQWVGLREVGSLRDIDTFEELRPLTIYQRI
ncbi:hypothetical protein KP509_24G053900 [Ceratopteris richardii]|uniref:Myb-like domain-containing protein n=1 Tax=Ceratopteris richardii TaxID=49495 RepID=A0A8T2RX43_CERRI|nr:hypothetical protein KP509_24G053900 [Ceratopteris richardii]KAH7300274.1 hypothetical protein KP509_24G053900 [Ceratopteris richardii]